LLGTSVTRRVELTRSKLPSGTVASGAFLPYLKTCELILLQLEIPLETVYAAIEFGKRHGIKTLLNPAPATRALDLQRILHVTFFMPNETELALLSGRPVGTVAEIEAAARSLIAEGIGTVIDDGGARRPARDPD
jgi:ribokinase